MKVISYKSVLLQLLTNKEENTKEVLEARSREGALKDEEEITAGSDLSIASERQTAAAAANINSPFSCWWKRTWSQPWCPRTRRAEHQAIGISARTPIQKVSLTVGSAKGVLITRTCISPSSGKETHLGKLSGEDEAHRGLDFAGGEGLLLAVARQAHGLVGHAIESVVDERVHDGHGALGDASLGVDLPQDLKRHKERRSTLLPQLARWIEFDKIANRLQTL